MTTGGMIGPFADVFGSLQCAACEPRTGRSTLDRMFDAGTGVVRGAACRACGADFTVADGYLDLHPGFPEPVTPIQHLMQFRPAVAIYEGLWRPLGYRLASRRSFPADTDHIVSLVSVGGRGLVLDLACGPGNFARAIARRAPSSVVIGFDLSPEMLSRAVRLTAREGLQNVCYVRGSALALPFTTEAFDAIVCCGALQLFSDQERAVSEIARVLKTDGDFICQTTLGPPEPPAWVRLADRVLKFGFFRQNELTARLDRFRLGLRTEERSKISYIFRAAKSE